jgi:hypothetical protein
MLHKKDSVIIIIENTAHCINAQRNNGIVLLTVKTATWQHCVGYSHLLVVVGSQPLKSTILDTHPQTPSPMNQSNQSFADENMRNSRG